MVSGEPLICVVNRGCVVAMLSFCRGEASKFYKLGPAARQRPFRPPVVFDHLDVRDIRQSTILLMELYTSPAGYY